jgi:hypothetical protein
MTGEKLYQYYRNNAFLPTHANFSREDAFIRYAEHRLDFYQSKLYLPVRFFNEADILEFGPDTGENATVFALWGANLTLVEPNQAAWPHINAYFERFGLASRLMALSDADFDGYTSPHLFDFVNAEGFIYTIQPMSRWVERIPNLLKPDGFCCVSYYERAGGFLELLLKVVQAAGRRITKDEPVSVARRFFQTKWDAIPHTRPFASWVMDVLENPFVRLANFIDAGDLCRQMASQGMMLHSSWPRYKDELIMRWHKVAVSQEDRLASSLENIARTRLGSMFGQKLLLTGPLSSVVAVGERVDQLLALVDRMIDRLEPSTAAEAGGILTELAGLMDSDCIFSADDTTRGAVLTLIRTCKNILELVASGQFDALETLCNTDSSFILSWGVPHHYAVFNKIGAASDGT